MDWRSFNTFLILALLASPATAQSDLGSRYKNGSERSFAEPLFWLNAGRADRLPIRERKLTPRLGFAGLAPPPDTRQRFTPFASTSFTFASKTEQTRSSDAFGALGVGALYRFNGRRQQIQADYYGELTSADGSGGGVQNHGGALSYNFSLTQHDSLALLASRSETTDLQSAPLAGAITNATKFTSSNFSLTFARDHSGVSGFNIGLSGLAQSTDQSGSSGTNTYALDGSYWHFVAPLTRFETNLKAVDFDIGGRGFKLQELDLGLTRDLGARTAVSGRIGLMNTNADGGHVYPNFSGAFVTTALNTRLELAVDRDIIAVPGLATPALTDNLSLHWEQRISHGWLSTISLEKSRLKELSPGGSVTHTHSLEGQMSYAIDRKNWLWAKLRLTREKQSGVPTNETRFTVGISRNLR